MQIAQMEFPQEAELEGRQQRGRRGGILPGIPSRRRRRRRRRWGGECQPCAVAVSGDGAATETVPAVSGRGGTGGISFDFHKIVQYGSYSYLLHL